MRWMWSVIIITTKQTRDINKTKHNEPQNSEQLILDLRRSP